LVERTVRDREAAGSNPVIPTISAIQYTRHSLAGVFHSNIKERKVADVSQADVGQAVVGVIMGSTSDYETMKAATAILEAFDVSYEVAVVSAHRTPDKLYDYAKGARARGLRVIIAGAGGAAHLPGMVAAMTILPVIGVPVMSRALQGLDSLLSIVQMPGGVPVATVAIGAAGAKNAGLLAVAILATADESLADQLTLYRQQQTDDVLSAKLD